MSRPRRFRLRIAEPRWSGLLAAALVGIAFAAALAVILRTPSGADSGGHYVSHYHPPTTTAPPAPVPLTAARDALASAHNVLILGDSTGNGLNEWVADWGRSLTTVRTVSIRQWDFKRQAFAPAFTPLGGDGPDLAFWNLSQPGGTADYPTRRDRLDGVGGTPDLIVYSYGHNDTPDDIDRQLTKTAEETQRRWGTVPQVVILQNPSTGTLADRDAEVTNYLRTMWAPTHQASTVDVEQAFLDSGQGAALMLDVTHPNEAGSELWAQTVEKALNP